MPAKLSTIIYDGECSFCIAQIDRIRRMDTQDVFEYLPAQSPELAARFPMLKEMNLESGMRFVSQDGKKVAVGADAVYEIARRLKATGWFAWIYLLPVAKQIARAMYAWVAANRKKLGRTCAGGVCKMPATTGISVQSRDDHK